MPRDPCPPHRPRSGPARVALPPALALAGALLCAAGGARAQGADGAPAAPAAAQAALPGSATAQGPTWATAQAAELSRQGGAHAARGDADEAARRFLEAIGFDPTYGPAYLGLGALNERRGDPREAERTYTMGIEHVTGFAAGHRARAALRLRQRRLGEGIADLEAAAALRPADVALLLELAAAYVTAAAFPAALGVTRHVEALAAAQGDDALQAEARTQARALSTLIGEADPVRAGLRGRGPVRRAIAIRAAGPAARSISPPVRTR